MKIPTIILIAALIFGLVCAAFLISALLKGRQAKSPVILPVVALCQVATCFLFLALMLKKALEANFDFVFWMAFVSYIFFQAAIIRSYHALFSRWKQLHETGAQTSLEKS
jgi:hypothetical protein